MALVGINIGAGQRTRAIRAALVGGGVAFAGTELIGVGAALWPRAWLALFGSAPEMLAVGAAYLRVVGPAYGFFGLGLALFFASQGAGRVAWPLEDLALGYKQLMRVESRWRTIKSGLRTRPVFHWKPHRISAHVSLCVLALLIERIVEIRTGQTWGNVRALLDTVKVVEYERGSALVRQTTELRAEVEALLSTLKLAAPQRFHSVATAPAA